MSTLFDIGYIIGIQLFELLSSLLIMTGIFQCKLRKAPRMIIWMIILIPIIMTGIIISGNQNNAPPITFLVEIIIILVCIDERLSKKTTVYLIAYIISYIMNSFIVLLLSIMFNMDESLIVDHNNWRIITILLNLGLIFLFIKTINRDKNEITHWIRNISINYFIIGLPGLLCCALVLAFIQIGRVNPINNIWDKVALFGGIMVCIFYIIGTVIIILINNKKKHYQIQNQLKDKYLNIQHNYYDMILRNDKDLRRFRHDIKSQIGCMRILAEYNKYDELVNYIAEISDQVDYLLNRNYNSGNDIVDALINYLAIEAEEDEITIYIEGTLPKDLKIARMDLCTIFSNSISNAIEACRLIKTKEKRRIEVIFSNWQNTLMISIENSVSEPVDLYLLDGNTTKNDINNHGFGIMNIRDAVKKYNGKVNFINQESKFKVEILFHNIL